jgi:hypothetical protein
VASAPFLPVNADSYDSFEQDHSARCTSRSRPASESHEELVAYAHRGRGRAGRSARIEISGGKGAININVLWEMGGAQRMLHGVLERTQRHGRGRDLRRRNALQAERDRRATMASIIFPSSARRAPFARCGSGPIHKVQRSWLGGGGL